MTLPQSIGARVKIRLGDEEFLCNPLVLRDYATLKLEMDAQRLRAAAKAGEGLPKSVQDRLIDRAYQVNENADIEDALRWAESDPHGAIYTYWLMLARDYPQRGFTFDQVAEVLKTTAPEDQADNARRMAMAGGLDESGNGIGPLTSGQEKTATVSESKTGE